MSEINKINKLRYITVVGILSALSAVLMFFSFNVPFMPFFIKLDFSELPALVAAFSLGPVAGVAVCFIKNLINLFFTNTAGVGELSNFILGCCFVLPAGLIYKHKKSKLWALIGSVIGAFTMAFVGFFTNMFVVYPFYFAVMMPKEAVLNAYTTLLPFADTLPKALLIFNAPFTFMKGMFSVVITMLIYKKISPILKGTFR